MRSALVASALLLSLAASSAACAEGLVAYGLPHCNENERVWVQDRVDTFPGSRTPEVTEFYVCNPPMSEDQVKASIKAQNDMLARTKVFPNGAIAREVTVVRPLEAPQSEASGDGVFASVWAALTR